jgi:predicted enzyme related to lactoylglutathione lyase
MERVTGVGGIFLRARDATALRAWYAEKLGIDINPEVEGAIFPAGGSSLIWAVFPSDTEYFGSHHQMSMVNYRVDDLAAMLAQLRADGVDVEDDTDETPDGWFGWAADPEGNRFELWQPRPGGG